MILIENLLVILLINIVEVCMYFTCLFLYIGCLLTIIFYIFQILFGSLFFTVFFTVPFTVGLLLLIYCIINILNIAVYDPFIINKDSYE